MKAIPRRFLRLLVFLMAAASLPGLAVNPPLVDCPATDLPGDNFGREGFYVPSFPGTTLKDVTLYLEFPSAGTYGLTLTARRDAFDGVLLGNSVASVSVSADLLVPVTFVFTSPPAVTPGTTVTFQHAVVSGPAGSVYYGVQTILDSCPVVQTNDFQPPLSTFRRPGIAIRINGDPDGNGTLKTVTIPASASIHGVNGAFFHSDVQVFNRYSEALNVTARYRCFAGQNCGTGTVTFQVKGYGGMVFSDIVGNLFHAPETAGAIELTYRSFVNDDALHAFSRVYTPALPNPTNGAAVSGYPGSAATGSSIFVGLANNGGSRASGFRTNAGAYNPYGRSTKVTFSIYRNDGNSLGSGSLLGSYSATWGPNEAKQVNDIFAAAGIGATVTTDAFMIVFSDLPVLPYVTVIDNVTGDSVVQGPKAF